MTPHPSSRKAGLPWGDEPEPLWLVTPEEYEALPDGTRLENIFGRKVVKGVDYIDSETRAGYLAYGIRESVLALPLHVEGMQALHDYVSTLE